MHLILLTIIYVIVDKLFRKIDENYVSYVSVNTTLINGMSFDYYPKTIDMTKPKNSSQKTFVYLGVVITSAMVLAAFTYSEKNQFQIELAKVEPVEINFTIQKTKKTDIKKPDIPLKKISKQVATNIKKNVSSTSQITKNTTKSINNNVKVKGIDINFNTNPNYKIVDIIEPAVVDFPDIEAEFTGGYSEMNKYITHNLKLNELYSLINTNELLVPVEFIVSENGKIIDVKIKDKVNYELKNQIINLMKGMPKWIPAELNGRKVSSRIFLPIRIYFQ